MTIHDITLNVNGSEYSVTVEARKTLADTIREDCGLTGTKVGCEHGICGTCTVLLDDEPVRACLLFAVQCNGHRVRTIEGLATAGQMHPLQKKFTEYHALQCGFCTPGFLMLSVGTLEKNPELPDEDVREMVSSNLCRCTGYQNIIKAVIAAKEEMS